MLKICTNCTKEFKTSHARTHYCSRACYYLGREKRVASGDNPWAKFKYAKGVYKSPLYNIWSSMKQRCYDSNVPNFHRYGGRGIKVSEEWQDFMQFYQDMSPTYQKGLTIERIDNDGGYKKENCKWATRQEQANNRHSNRLINIDGVTKTLAQWVSDEQLRYTTVQQRIDAYGWSVKKALGKE